MCWLSVWCGHKSPIFFTGTAYCDGKMCLHSSFRERMMGIPGNTTSTSFQTDESLWEFLRVSIKRNQVLCLAFKWFLRSLLRRHAWGLSNPPKVYKLREEAHQNQPPRQTSILLLTFGAQKHHTKHSDQIKMMLFLRSYSFVLAFSLMFMKTSWNLSKMQPGTWIHAHWELFT